MSLVLCQLALLSLPALAGATRTSTVGCVGRDSDRDGICDDIEHRTGTAPLHSDTDRDGVPDGVEDANQDGRVDPGESDPRVPGLFPGTYPHIPEPMVFDLVRGLGARKGEVEVNALLLTRFGRGPVEFAWAPEVEWAFADGLALEFELPMTDRELQALKLAAQATFPSPSEDFVHGIQVIGEYLLTPEEAELTALYLAGFRVGAASFLGMLGLRTVTPMKELGQYEILVNPNLSYDVNEQCTIGLEGNVGVGLDGHTQVALIPQVHFQISRHFRIQVGGGVAFDGGESRPLVATRLILE